jgi:hypothetical protein
LYLLQYTLYLLHYIMTFTLTGRQETHPNQPKHSK